MALQTTFKNMNLHLKNDDAFRELSPKFGKDKFCPSEKHFTFLVINHLIENDLIEDGEFELCGKKLNKIEGIDRNVFESLFPGKINDENIEFFMNLTLWGDGIDDCEKCGCEMIPEVESHGSVTWENFSCENPFCDNCEINEPDWDTMPGGHDY